MTILTLRQYMSLMTDPLMMASFLFERMIKLFTRVAEMPALSS